MEKRNVRRAEEGYPITRAQYAELVELVRPNAQRWVGWVGLGGSLAGGCRSVRRWAG